MSKSSALASTRSRYPKYEASETAALTKTPSKSDLKNRLFLRLMVSTIPMWIFPVQLAR